jgi:signal transduction histidine kinase
VVLQNKATVTVGNLPTIKGNRRQLQQLFQNLITNALKYSQPTVPPIINITAEKVAEKDLSFTTGLSNNNQYYHLIKIKDNGIGFDKKDKERIFNVFTRLHGNNEYKGSGVGLSIVRKVVQNHHGFIDAESEVGKGATFSIALPIN